MDIDKVKQLVALVESSGLAELELREGADRIRLSSHSARPQKQAKAPEPVLEAVTLAAKTSTEKSETLVASPMVGVFYRKASATAAPFVEIGQHVTKGEVICIVEAMKMMNNVEATCSGVIDAIMVEDGQPVEYDQPLFTII